MLNYKTKKDGKYIDGKYVETDGTKVYWLETFVKRIECTEEKRKKKFTII